MDPFQVNLERLEASQNPENRTGYSLGQLRELADSINDREGLIIIDTNKSLSNLASQLLFYYQNPIQSRVSARMDQPPERYDQLGDQKYRSEKLYREILLLLRLNGFSLTQFRFFCQTKQRDFESCTNIFKAALAQDLGEPLLRGKLAIEAVSEIC